MTFRALHVEDEIDPRLQFARVLDSLSMPWEAVSAESLESATVALATQEFDLVVCDILIPPVDGSFARAAEHGFAVYDLVRASHPGTPAIFLTGHASDVDAWRPLENSPTIDLFGLGQDEGLTRLIQKDHPEKLRDYLSRMTAEMAALAKIDLATPSGTEILDVDERCLRIIARRRGGARVDITPSRGLSGASSFLAFAFDKQDRPVIRAFVKTGPLASMEEEEARHHRFVGQLLDSGNYPGIADRVIANARSRGALCYSFAGRYQNDLISLFADDPARFESTVARVREMVAPWGATAQRVSVNLGALRRLRVSDDVVDAYAGNYADLFARVEERTLDATEVVQHGDLHGLNVLVDSVGTPLLIDFADVGPHIGADDPVNLELSFIFHSQSREQGWLDVSTAHGWVDDDMEKSGMRHAVIARVCRGWAREAFEWPVDYLIPTFVHALRQLKYPDTNKEVAIEIAAAAGNALLGD